MSDAEAVSLVFPPSAVPVNERYHLYPPSLLRAHMHWLAASVCGLLLLCNGVSVVVDRCGAVNTVYQIIAMVFYAGLLCFVLSSARLAPAYTPTDISVQFDGRRESLHWQLVTALVCFMATAMAIYSVVNIFVGKRCRNREWSTFVLSLDTALPLTALITALTHRALDAVAQYRHNATDSVLGQTGWLMTTSRIKHFALYAGCVGIALLNLFGAIKHRSDNTGLTVMAIVHCCFASLASICLLIGLVLHAATGEENTTNRIEILVLELTVFQLVLMLLFVAALVLLTAVSSIVTLVFACMVHRGGGLFIISWLTIVAIWTVLALVSRMVIQQRERVTHEIWRVFTVGPGMATGRHVTTAEPVIASPALSAVEEARGGVSLDETLPAT